jgi:site-specific DNA recombinase
MRAAIYARVSTEGQEDNYSLPTQLEACRRYGCEHDLAIIADGELVDVASGATLNRPKLDTLRDLVRSGLIDAVIVYSVDRLARDPAVYYLLKGEFSRGHVALHYVTRGEIADTPEGVLSDGVDVLFAQIERLRIAERMRRGKRGKIEGSRDRPARVLGAQRMAPFGYCFIGSGREKRLELVQDEVEIVICIFTWYVHDGMSIHDIAVKLSELAVPAPADRGRNVVQRQRAAGSWARSTVNRILKSPTYAGTFYHYRLRKGGAMQDRQEWIGVPVPAIISQELFDAAQKKLAQGRVMSKRNTKTEYLLARRIRCECTHSLGGEVNKGRRIYRCTCRGREAIHRCTMRSVKADVVEVIVWEWLTKELEPDVLREGLERQRQDATERRANIVRQMDAQLHQHALLDMQLRRLIDGFQMGAISAAELAERRGLLDTAKASATAELERLDAQMRSSGLTDDVIDTLLAEATELHRELPYLTFARRRRLLDLIDLRVIIDVDDHSARWVNINARLVPGTVRLPLDSIQPITY